jgi:hypothetical protein
MGQREWVCTNYEHWKGSFDTQFEDGSSSHLVFILIDLGRLFKGV